MSPLKVLRLFMSATLIVPFRVQKKIYSNAGLGCEGKMNSPLCTFRHQFLYYSSAIHLLFCKVFSLYTHAKQRQFSELDILLCLKVPNVIYMEDSFPDCLSCQMEGSCREVATNVSQGTECRLDCGNLGY